ncbi:hypothetical protein ONS96_000544 [Cadophora gregata f. sp. sojae]|nr:hypothetical protein ONS96_000544 [Cadophora gregata f. sp. sojae]
MELSRVLFPILRQKNAAEQHRSLCVRPFWKLNQSAAISGGQTAATIVTCYFRLGFYDYIIDECSCTNECCCISAYLSALCNCACPTGIIASTQSVQVVRL